MEERLYNCDGLVDVFNFYSPYPSINKLSEQRYYGNISEIYLFGNENIERDESHTYDSSKIFGEVNIKWNENYDFNLYYDWYNKY